MPSFAMHALTMPNQLERENDGTQRNGGLRNDCLSLLKSLQNADGGWGFLRAGQSRVEPTCWAARALFDSGEGKERENLGQISHFLRSSQLADGSWPAFPGMAAGSWITSLACSVLKNDADSAANVKAGLKWLCEDFPRDSSPLRRLLQMLRRKSQIVSHNDTYRGWGWTPRTASWVEPTAFALMALREADPRLLPTNASQRRELAIALLYDRMCPGGGWNCGNPRVYGIAGDPLVLPTCWALLALRRSTPEDAAPDDIPEKSGRALSLAWLRKDFANLQSAGSLAVACMTLQNYGVEPPQARRQLQEWSAQNLAEQGTHVLAWTSMALNPSRNWPQPMVIPSERPLITASERIAGPMQ
jgi:hypothetical protein